MAEALAGSVYKMFVVFTVEDEYGLLLLTVVWSAQLHTTVCRYFLFPDSRSLNWKVVVQKEPRSVRVLADSEDMILPRQVPQDEVNVPVDTQASTQGTAGEDDYLHVPAHEVHEIIDRIRRDHAKRTMADGTEYWAESSDNKEDN